MDEDETTLQQRLASLLESINLLKTERDELKDKIGKQQLNSSSSYSTHSGSSRSSYTSFNIKDSCEDIRESIINTTKQLERSERLYRINVQGLENGVSLLQQQLEMAEHK
uniref:Uncharacterized LOC100187462 n=1 Tax=Ciona intestinalis TaxID=7719 RepID=F6UU67_CIOIN|nr:uncharacterized protein LOC100187462 isoform X2 [Ciona intestinalis]|eukprot:XP_002121945.1 uncharacterized protein LOC100187462 isoform X2 [Ciona intestinalis]